MRVPPNTSIEGWDNAYSWAIALMISNERFLYDRFYLVFKDESLLNADNLKEFIRTALSQDSIALKHWMSEDQIAPVNFETYTLADYNELVEYFREGGAYV